jgi:hypothetical protein
LIVCGLTVARVRLPARIVGILLNRTVFFSSAPENFRFKITHSVEVCVKTGPEVANPPSGAFTKNTRVIGEAEN